MIAVYRHAFNRPFPRSSRSLFQGESMFSVLLLKWIKTNLRFIWNRSQSEFENGLLSIIPDISGGTVTPLRTLSFKSFPTTAETPDIKASAIIQILDQAASVRRNSAFQFCRLVISLWCSFGPCNCLYICIKFSCFFSPPTRHNSFLGNSSPYINFWCRFAAWNSTGSLVS